MLPTVGLPSLVPSKKHQDRPERLKIKEAARNSKDVAQLLIPQGSELVLQAVNPLVNNPANDDARCLEPRGEGLLVGENRTLL
jgi:hypothetical protein